MRSLTSLVISLLLRVQSKKINEKLQALIRAHPTDKRPKMQTIDPV